MNDNDIIKALNNCVYTDHKDGKCTMCEYVTGCKPLLLREALGLINRQKAEIEELRNENLELKDGYFQKRYEETEHQELVGLREAWRKSQMDYIDLNAEWEGKYKIAKAEAIKEFAERFSEKLGKSKEIINICVDGVYESLADIINNLVKEMTEEKE